VYTSEQNEDGKGSNMELFLLWLLFAFFSAAIASSKNRSAFGWFSAGLLFGPFGLLVGFFPKIEQQSPGDEATKNCPFCAERIKRDAVLCRFCNRELSAPSSP
jgi:hypothetical protein